MLSGLIRHVRLKLSVSVSHSRSRSNSRSPPRFRSLSCLRHQNSLEYLGEPPLLH